MADDGAIKHSILGGKLHVDRRENSSQWQCSTFLAGKNHHVSTKTSSLAHAKAFAEDWYLGLRGKHAAGELKIEKTFRQAAAVFENEYEVITEGQRSPAYVRGHKDRIRLHLNPYFGSMALSAITAGAEQEYRVHRMKLPPRQKPRALRWVWSEVGGDDSLAYAFSFGLGWGNPCASF